MAHVQLVNPATGEVDISAAADVVTSSAFDDLQERRSAAVKRCSAHLRFVGGVRWVQLDACAKLVECCVEHALVNALHELVGVLSLPWIRDRAFTATHHSAECASLVHALIDALVGGFCPSDCAAVLCAHAHELTGGGTAYLLQRMKSLARSALANDHAVRTLDSIVQQAPEEIVKEVAYELDATTVLDVHIAQWLLSRVGYDCAQFVVPTALASAVYALQNHVYATVAGYKAQGELLLCASHNNDDSITIELDALALAYHAVDLLSAAHQERPDSAIAGVCNALMDQLLCLGSTNHMRTAGGQERIDLALTVATRVQTYSGKLSMKRDPYELSLCQETVRMLRYVHSTTSSSGNSQSQARRVNYYLWLACALAKDWPMRMVQAGAARAAAEILEGPLRSDLAAERVARLASRVIAFPACEEETKGDIASAVQCLLALVDGTWGVNARVEACCAARLIASRAHNTALEVFQGAFICRTTCDILSECSEVLRQGREVNFLVGLTAAVCSLATEVICIDDVAVQDFVQCGGIEQALSVAYHGNSAERGAALSLLSETLNRSANLHVDPNGEAFERFFAYRGFPGVHATALHIVLQPIDNMDIVSNTLDDSVARTRSVLAAAGFQQCLQFCERMNLQHTKTKIQELEAIPALAKTEIRLSWMQRLAEEDIEPIEEDARWLRREIEKYETTLHDLHEKRNISQEDQRRTRTEQLNRTLRELAQAKQKQNVAGPAPDNITSSRSLGRESLARHILLDARLPPRNAPTTMTPDDGLPLLE